jgi:integrase
MGTTKTKSRRPTVGIADGLAEELLALKQESPFNRPDDVVFSSSKGTPLDGHNVNNRIFRPLAAELGFPISWHIFRHSAATFCEHVEMPMSDREKLMGHAAAHMTAHYTHSDVLRRRRYQNEIAARLLPPKGGMPVEKIGAGNPDDPSLAELERIFSLEKKE